MKPAITFFVEVDIDENTVTLDRGGMPWDQFRDNAFEIIPTDEGYEFRYVTVVP